MCILLFIRAIREPEGSVGGMGVNPPVSGLPLPVCLQISVKHVHCRVMNPPCQRGDTLDGRTRCQVTLCVMLRAGQLTEN